MAKINIFIPISIHHWRTKSTEIGSFGFKAIDECKNNFDQYHYCSKPNQCEYCDSKWEIKNGEWTKTVDHDGAVVEYIVKKITIN